MNTDLSVKCHVCHILLHDVNSEEEHKLYKHKWNKILTYIKKYGMGGKHRGNI